MRARYVPSLFSRHTSRNGVRSFSTELPATLETFVWLPAIKKRDNDTSQIISREVLSASEAKRRYALRVKGVDPWGHAAARIFIDCTDNRRNEELRERIQELAVINRVVSLKDSSAINVLQAYFSLYPDHNKPPRGGFTESEKREWVEHTNTGDLIVDKGKALSLPLFNQKYAAFNNNHQSVGLW